MNNVSNSWSASKKEKKMILQIQKLGQIKMQDDL